MNQLLRVTRRAVRFNSRGTSLTNSAARRGRTVTSTPSRHRRWRIRLALLAASVAAATFGVLSHGAAHGSTADLVPPMSVSTVALG